MSTTTERTVNLVIFSFGILEQGGGFENYVTATARGLTDRYENLHITIVTMDRKTVERLQYLLSIYFMKKQSAQAIYRETYESIKTKIGRATYCQAHSLADLKCLLQKADVIYAKNEVLELFTLNRIGLKKLPPIILGIHTPIYYPYTPSMSARLHNLLYMGPVYRAFIKHVQSIQVNNGADLELVQTKLGFKNAKHIKQAFEVSELKPRTLHPGKLRLLFVGRLTEAKGVDILIEVIEMLEQHAPGSFSMKIAGSGDEAIVKQITRLAEKIEGVEYLGHIPNEDVMQLYEWADVTVITSKYETLNKVAVETAIAGKVVVCTDIPGPREVIVDGVTGFLVPLDAPAFVERIKALAVLKSSDPLALQELGSAAHEYVRTKFNADRAYAELYKDIVAVSAGSEL